MNKITNLKTSKSYRQKKDKKIALEAKKNFHLKNTDWSQLNDIVISNDGHMRQWREKLRNFNIPDDPDNKIEDRLDRLLKSKPAIGAIISRNKDNPNIKILEDKIRELENTIDKLSNNKTQNNIIVDEEQAREISKKSFEDYKNTTLVNNGILEYNMMRTLLEEAIDKGIDPDNNGILLDEYMKTNNISSLEDVIIECKNFFKKINSLYASLSKEKRSLYNMSINELNNWFKENGYRYRCYNSNEPT